MATAEHIPGSILSSVVEHEKSLLARLHQAREAAKATVDKAKAEARGIVQAEENRLVDESAAMRHEAEQARERAFAETINSAEAQLVGVRQSAKNRIPAVADKVMDLFVPKGSGEWKS